MKLADADAVIGHVGLYDRNAKYLLALLAPLASSDAEAADLYNIIHETCYELDDWLRAVNARRPKD
jgi:hypothetical protein